MRCTCAALSGRRQLRLSALQRHAYSAGAGADVVYRPVSALSDVQPSACRDEIISSAAAGRVPQCLEQLGAACCRCGDQAGDADAAISVDHDTNVIRSLGEALSVSLAR
jgi:hypothetical protein